MRRDSGGGASASRAASATCPSGNRRRTSSRMRSQTIGWESSASTCRARAVDADQRLVDQPQELGILAASAAQGVVARQGSVPRAGRSPGCSPRLRRVPGSGSRQTGDSKCLFESSASPVQSQPISRAVPSRLRIPNARAASSMRPVSLRTCRPAHAVSDAGRTSESSRRPARRSVSRIACDECARRLAELAVLLALNVEDGDARGCSRRWR